MVKKEERRGADADGIGAEIFKTEEEGEEGVDLERDEYVFQLCPSFDLWVFCGSYNR